MSSSSPYVVGRYAIFDEIASGGMATVHLGRLVADGGFSRLVAIKRLHPQFAKDAEFAAMFLDEARLAARIHHPNVVQTIDVVTIERELLLVMEYVHGVSLAALLAASREAGARVEPRHAAAIVAAMLEGLHAAHEATDEAGAPLGVVHRDVSPHNVLVGVDGVPRLIDFGVAKAAGKMHATRGGQLKGKLAYMSPEQVQSQPVGRASDVFAAGVVLWEALMGERLFDGENPGELVMQVLAHPIESPRARFGDLPEALDAAVMRALARDPSARYPTARAMAEALDHALRLAPPREIARWVEAAAGPLLAPRRELVSKVQAGLLTPPGEPAPRASSAGFDARSAPTLAAPLAVLDALSTDDALARRDPLRHRDAPPDPLARTVAQAGPADAVPRSAPARSAPDRASSPPVARRIPVMPPAEMEPRASLSERLEVPLKMVAVGALLSVVDAVARPYIQGWTVRPLWVAEILVVVGVLWALARLALPSRDAHGGG